MASDHWLRSLVAGDRGLSLAAMADPAHWDERYRTVGPESVSWFEDEPATSLSLLSALHVRRSDSVIDVGGGASTLVDHLLAAGHGDVAVLDLSEVALAEARGAAWVSVLRWHGSTTTS